MLHLFCGCLAEAGEWMVLSMVGLLCLHSVTFCCTLCKVESPPWMWLRSLGYLIAKILHYWWVCGGHRGVRKGRVFTGLAGWSYKRSWRTLTSEGREKWCIVQLCPPLLLHQFCTIARNFTFFNFRVWPKLSDFRFGFFSIGSHWQMKKSRLVLIVGSQALSNSLIL